MKFYGIQVSEGSNIANLSVATAASFPTNPNAGELFYLDSNDVNEGLYVHNGSTWALLGTGTTYAAGTGLSLTGNTFSLGTLSNSGSGTFMKLARDTYGRVSGTAAVTSADVTTLVDSVYANVTGDNFTGDVSITTGKLGVGATSPSTLVHMTGDATSGAILQIDGTGAIPSIVGRRANGTIGSKTAMNSDQNLLTLDATGYGTTGYASTSRAGFRLLTAEAWTDSAQGTYATINTTAPGSTTINERLRVNGDGTVSIGTTSKQAQFEVATATSGAAAIKVSSSLANSVFRGFAIGATNDSVEYGSLKMDINSGELRHISGFATWGGYHTFYTNGTEKMRVTAAGVIQDAAGLELGYKVVPRIGNTATAGVTERGKAYANTAGQTIPASVFAAGDSFSIYNDSASAITITEGSGLTLRQAGTTNTGSRTLAARGFVTVWFNSATEAIIRGDGLT